MHQRAVATAAAFAMLLHAGETNAQDFCSDTEVSPAQPSSCHPAGPIGTINPELDNGDNIAFIGTAWTRVVVGFNGATSPPTPIFQRRQLGGSGPPAFVDVMTGVQPLLPGPPHNIFMCWRDSSGAYHLDEFPGCASTNVPGTDRNVHVEALGGDDSVVVMRRTTSSMPHEILCPVGRFSDPDHPFPPNSESGNIFLGSLYRHGETDPTGQEAFVIPPDDWGYSAGVTIEGGSGEDSIFGSSMNDVLHSNTHFFTNSECGVFEDGEEDLLCGFQGNDTLVGESDGARECIAGGINVDGCYPGDGQDLQIPGAFDDAMSSCENYGTPPNVIGMCSFRGEFFGSFDGPSCCSDACRSTLESVVATWNTLLP